MDKKVVELLDKSSNSRHHLLDCRRVSRIEMMSSVINNYKEFKAVAIKRIKTLIQT